MNLRLLAVRPARSVSQRVAPSVPDAIRIVNRLKGVVPPSGLSRRERELLPWLATDLSYSAIARHLRYGPDNARLIAKRLLAKLGVRTRPAAVARWLRADLFLPDEMQDTLLKGVD